MSDIQESVLHTASSRGIGVMTSVSLLPGRCSLGLGRLVTHVCGHIRTLAGCSEPSRNFFLVSGKCIPPSGVWKIHKQWIAVLHWPQLIFPLSIYQKSLHSPITLTNKLSCFTYGKFTKLIIVDSIDYSDILIFHYNKFFRPSLVRQESLSLHWPWEGSWGEPMPGNTRPPGEYYLQLVTLDSSTENSVKTKQ